METALPIIFVMVIGFALLLYVILDGYDLGVGLLLPLARDDDKDRMIASIGPFWDANETWIVLGIGVLLIAFPEAYGIILTSLYLPVTIMLFGLILRGVAFDFRVKAGDRKKPMWNKAFFAGSLLAACSQGWMLGSYITGLEHTWINSVFSVLIALALPALYVVLGASWILIKCEGTLYQNALRWGRIAMLPMAVGLLLISIATPLVSQVIADRWFQLPNIIGLMPIPVVSAITLGVVYWLFSPGNRITESSSWTVFAGLVLICLLAATGLAYSIFPDIIIGQLSIFDTTVSTKSLLFVLVGVVITLPLILGYTILVYRIFSGKATELNYH